MEKRDPKEILKKRAYLQSALPSTTPYFTDQPRQNTRLLESTVNVGIATSLAYGAYRILDIPLQARQIEFLNKYLSPKLAQKFGSPDTYFRLLRETIPGAEKTVDKALGKTTITASVDAKNAWKKFLNVEEIVKGSGQYSFSGKHYLYNLVRTVEDSIYKFPRTFQISPLMSSWVFKDSSYHIAEKEAQRLLPYLKEYFPKAATITSEEVLKHGISYEKGALKVGETSLGKANLVLYEAVQEGEVEAGKYYRTQLGNSLFEKKGMKPILGKKPYLALPVPAESWKDFTKLLGEGKLKEARKLLPQLKGVPQVEALVNNAVRRYINVVSNPLSIYEELGGKLDPRVKTVWNKYGLGKLLGTGLDHSRMPTSALLKRHLFHAGVFGLGAYAGYSILDATLEKLPDFTLFGKGIAPGLAEIGKRLDVGYSKLSEKTGLTRFAEFTENTLGEKLTPAKLLALPAAAALTGAIGTRVIGKQLARKAAGGGPAGLMAAEKWISEDLVPSVSRYRGPIGRAARGLGKRGISLTPGKFGGLIGAAIGALAMLPLLPFAPAALASRDRPDELAKEYEGFKDVVVRKGKWWLFGKTSFEGSRGQTTVPNWYQRLKIDAHEKSLYPEEYQHRPIKRFLKGLVDPEWLEKKHYYDRPYPTSGPSDDVSQLYAMTVGRILKTPKRMHVDEMTGGQGERTQLITPGARTEELYVGERGGLPQETALDQSSLRYQGYQFGERWLKTKPGLLTYALSSVKEAITGSSSYFDEYSYLESANRINSLSERFWEGEQGDPLALNEGLRRILLPRRFNIEYRNPLKNKMPSWVPGAGDKALDFKTGDPYNKVPYGELQLPGAGFVARFPELEGVPAEEYPDIYKYKILSSIAPYSDQFKYYKDRVQTIRSTTDSWNPYWEEMYQQTEEMLPERKARTEFMDTKDNIFSKYWLSVKQLGRRLPSEHLTPLAPMHKFAGPIDALSQYKEDMLAPTFAPWGSPISSFVKPTLRMTADTLLLGNYPIPDEVQSQREATEYFDKLTYMKNMKLAKEASDIGSADLATQFRKAAEKTNIGSNPYGYYGNVFTAVPSVERNFFGPFAQETDKGKREDILNASPEYMHRIYNAMWTRQDLEKEAGEGEAGLQELRAKLAEVRSSEGFDPNLYEKTMYGNGGVGKGIRMKVLSNYFSEHDLPAPNHIAWHPAVDLEDIKLKVVENQSEDIHMHNLWETRQRELWRKPYLDEGIDEISWEDSYNNSLLVRQQIKSMLSSNDGRSPFVAVDTIPGFSNNILELDLFHDRSAEATAELKRQGRIR